MEDASTRRPGRRIGSGREAEIFDRGDGTVLRLLLDPGAGERLEREAIALRGARAAGLPVPAVHGTVVEDGRPGLILERIDGPDLLSRIGARPWTLWSAGDLCGRLHAQINSTAAPSALPTLQELLERRISYSELIPPALAEAALRRLAGMPAGEALCHNDFNPANVLCAPDRSVIIDWTAAAHGDPDSDVARAWIVMGIGAPHPGAPWVVRRLDWAGRRILLRAYMRAYRRVRSVDWARVQGWIPVHAAERLDKGLAEERSALIRIATRLLQPD